MKIETKNLEGREHFVVPMVMLVAGVLDGSNGPMLYSAEELRASVPLWNGRPVVVYHPEMQGSSYAGRPEVFTEQRVGTIFNTRFENNSLKADAWIDVARAEAVDPRILRAVRNEEIMELSTGVSSDLIKQQGTFNGEAYSVVAQKLIGDHLALLPDKVGASSIADGAGFVRNSLNTIQPLETPDHLWGEPIQV